MSYYKAVRPDGTSFWDPEFRWVPSTGPVEGIVVEHPNPDLGEDAAGYLSVSTAPADCTGMQWPLRLLEVEPVDGHPVHTSDSERLPNKRTASAWRVVRELPAHLALGPQGEHVAALLTRVPGGEAVYELRRPATWYAARGAAWGAARSAARVAAWYAARTGAWAVTRTAAKDVVWDAAHEAAWDAAGALTVRDLLAREHYDILTAAWRTAVGPIHPDDVDLRGEA